MYNNFLSLKAFLHRAFDVPCGILFCGNVTLIVKLFTFTKSNLNFCSAFLEINGKGNERKAVLLDRSEKLVDFFFVHQKLSDSHRIAVKNIAVIVRTYVHSVYEYFTVNNIAPSVLKIKLSLTD